MAILDPNLTVWASGSLRRWLVPSFAITLAVATILRPDRAQAEPPAETPPSTPASGNATPSGDAAAESKPPNEDAWAEYEDELRPTAPPPRVEPSHVSAPPAASTPAKPVKPVRQPKSGIGLLIAGPLVAAAGVPFSLLGNMAYRRTCVDSDAATASEEALECTAGVFGSIALHTLAFVAYAGGVGMTGGGAMLRGRFNAWDDVQSASERRSTVGFKAGGGVLVGLSAALLLTSRIMLWVRMLDCDDVQCVQTRQNIATALVGTSVIGLGAGVGMLGYAGAYDRGLRRYGGNVALLPAIGTRHGGLRLVARF